MLPSFIITGFLGSGKTTLAINSIKHAFEDKKVAIVVNEFGEVGFDGKVLKNVYSEVLELSEGCICCTLSSQFEKGVKEIMEKYAPDVLFVETSGVSEPFPIMLSLQSIGFSVEGVICMVDVANFEKYESSTTAKHQIGSSNIIVLNKADLIDSTQLDQVEERVKQIRKKYSLRNFFTGEEVFPKYIILKTAYGKLPKEIFSIVNTTNLNVEQIKHESHEGEFFYQETIKFRDNITYEYLEKYLKELPKSVIRAKGIVRVADAPNPLLVSYSFGNLDIVGKDPTYQGESFLVLIGFEPKHFKIQMEIKSTYIRG